MNIKLSTSTTCFIFLFYYYVLVRRYRDIYVNNINNLNSSLEVIVSEGKSFLFRSCLECKKDVRFVEDTFQVWLGFCKKCNILLVIRGSSDKNPKRFKSKEG